MNRSPFPKLLGTAAKLDFVLPELCCNCGLTDTVALKEIALSLSRYGIRLVESPGFVMDLPFCKLCLHESGSPPVTLRGAKKSFFGKVRKVFLHCRNHAFAQAFKAANRGLIDSGWIQVIDGGTEI